jgi:hypothetical protein
MYDKATQMVSFHMEGTEVFAVGGVARTYSIAVDGPAAPLGGDRASGRATFQMRCAASGNPAADCPYTSMTGTIGFAVIFPELAGAASDDAASVPAGKGGGGGGSSTGLIAVGAIAAALIGGGLAEARRRKNKQDKETAALLKNARAAVGSDRSGGHEDVLEYGASAGTAAPAASKAFEALVVGQGPRSSTDEPLVKDPDAANKRDEERERERQTGSDTDGR